MLNIASLLRLRPFALTMCVTLAYLGISNFASATRPSGTDESSAIPFLDAHLMLTLGWALVAVLVGVALTRTSYASRTDTVTSLAATSIAVALTAAVTTAFSATSVTDYVDRFVWAGLGVALFMVFTGLPILAGQSVANRRSAVAA